LPPSVLHDSATATLAEMLRALSAEPSNSVVVDVSALERFDSTALAVLLELRRAALQAGKTLALQAMPQRLQNLAALYGIAELLPSTA